MKLFWKIFASFSVAMAVTLFGAVFVSFRLAEQAFEDARLEDRSALIDEAANILSVEDEDGLRQWLGNNRRPSVSTLLLIIDSDGKEMLGWPVSDRLVRAITRSGGDPRGRPGNFLPQRIAPRLIGNDGREYYLFFSRPPPTLFGVLDWPRTQIAVLLLAITVAALTALILARYIATPIGRLQSAARSLAAGELATRVEEPLGRRHDEFGTLARDFDTMAEQIQSLVMAKETLMRDVSHELRSPLARIRVALALAERSSDGTHIQPQLDRIEKETERLDELVGQVLLLTRLRTQKPHDKVPVELNELLEEITANARFEHREIDVQFETSDKGIVLGLREELRSALENIVRNALAYAGSPGQVVISLQRTATSIVVSVTDNGNGVPAAELEKIFEPFYRTDVSRDHGRSGEGIGLAITARVIERHGGRVTARNTDHGGLCVTVTLPADNTKRQTAE